MQVRSVEAGGGDVRCLGSSVLRPLTERLLRGSEKGRCFFVLRIECERRAAGFGRALPLLGGQRGSLVVK